MGRRPYQADGRVDRQAREGHKVRVPLADVVLCCPPLISWPLGCGAHGEATWEPMCMGGPQGGQVWRPGGGVTRDGIGAREVDWILPGAASGVLDDVPE